MKLTATQILSTALQRDDGTLTLPPNLEGGAAQKVVGKLLAERLVEEISARGSMPVWRRDDKQKPIALRITEAGLAAIQGVVLAASRRKKRVRLGAAAVRTKRRFLPSRSRPVNLQSPSASLRAAALPNRTA